MDRSSGQLDLLRAALEGERPHSESARQRHAVNAGKRRQAERGEHLGGPLPDGYRKDDFGLVVVDTAREPVVGSILDLARYETPDAQIARSLTTRCVHYP